MGIFGSKGKVIELTVLVEAPFSMTNADIMTPLSAFSAKYKKIMSKEIKIVPSDSITKIVIGLKADRDKAVEAEQDLKLLYQHKGIDITVAISE